MKRSALKRTAPITRKAPMRRTPIAAGTTRMRQTRSTRTPTKAQAARFSAIRGLGCMACRMNAERGMPTTQMAVEIHHHTSGGRRLGHDVTVALCRFHHQGDAFPFIAEGYRANAAIFGPSFGREPQSFRALYGSDAELLDHQNRLIHPPEAA